MKEVLKMQYEQLLEIHKSYFTVLLHMLAIYLAIMGWCGKVVYESKHKLNEGNQESTFPLLAVFAVIVSVLFFIGLWFGKQDAIGREKQISDVARQLEIEPIGVKLFKNVIQTMIVGTLVFIVIWIGLFIKGIVR